jgi:uncharacterized protein (UPF0332 family)
VNDSIVGSLLAKAAHACASARLLLQSDDLDGACNRAYYAMFHAARAALIAVEAPDMGGKTHSGLIAAFGLHLVKNGPLPVELGRSFNHVEHVRVIADYRDEAVSAGDVRAVIEQAETFVDAIRRQFGGVK